MNPFSLTVYALAVLAGVLAARARAYALTIEHADCGEPCDLPSVLAPYTVTS